MELVTPLGRIQVLLDGDPIPCSIIRLDPLENLCPDIAARYKIEVDYTPDGKEHLISCCLYPTAIIKDDNETGERLECHAYYSEDELTKVSIGLEAESDYLYDNNGRLTRYSEYDYDGEFIAEDGMFYNSYVILPFTKTTHYVFGVAWIFNCTNERDIQTWFGADPTIM